MPARSMDMVYCDVANRNTKFHFLFTINGISAQTFNGLLGLRSTTLNSLTHIQ